MNGSDEQQLTETERAVLVACYSRMKAIAARKVTKQMRPWDRTELQELKANGPRYSPAEWFGEGRTVPDRYRMRYLRAVQNLEARDLVTGTASEGGRLTWLKLTAEGERVAAALVKETEGEAEQEK